ncbi:hypothetical protein AWZ03_000445 [Drosophila navojoa]|uniref:DUF4794 domain-containing protein n=1 Tax=Drosophila navojoa TaxID=7232 RepID=A0A484BYA8_DRONA|nr:mediator of RNA polymerase II transcription subunit 15 [Drosophila navojoa]TDG52902.1 hypothetical protein AWZ03_000445 [Drosophila navojoa]
MMSRALLLLLLALVGASHAATHVNISIAQQPATNPADVTIIDGEAPAELKAGPYRMQQEQRFARLQERPQQQQQQQQQQLQQQQPQQQQQQMQSQQQPLTPRQGLGLQSAQPVAVNPNARMPRRRMHSRRPTLYQQPPHSGQFRQRNQQLRQNQEFERYIQSYHSHGPTVETVFESSSPSPQRYTQSSSSSSSSSSLADDDAVSIGGSRSQQLRMFERQVVAPAASQGQSANVEQAADSKPVYEPQAPLPAPVQAASIAPAPVSSSSSSTSSSSSSAAAPAPAPASTPNDVKIGSNNFEPAYDPSFDNSYNRPSYDQGGYSYDDSQADYQDQYPPNVDEASSYDDYADQSGGYLPPQRGYAQPAPPRPVVTKTIQIVQPALKAKKYEVRHPAIQKEFYDIEERVVIKPAGTLVVELDHPVAKIPRGETLLPLGHPHPAVASAYNNNGQVQTQSYNNNGNEYRPSYDTPQKEQQLGTTIGSSVTTMPSYDQAPKDEYVEAQLQQQPGQGSDALDGNRQSLPSPSPSSSSSSSSSSSVIATDGNGNQYQINKKHLTPKMLTRVEPEQQPDYEYGRSEASYPTQRGYQRNSYNRAPYQTPSNDDYFSGEFLPNANAGNVEAKPARLEEAPPRTQIIKHEHKIHLPPSQHNIYLGRSRQPALKERRITEVQEVPANVAELKPYLRNHAGPTVVYAKSTVRTAAPRGFYQQASRQRSPLAEELKYSAPYSRMRYDPELESSSGRLVEATKQSKPAAKAQINLQIPHQDDRDQSIVATATITPLKPDCDQQKEQQEERSSRLQQYQPQQQFQRLVEAPAPAPVVATTQATPTPAQQPLDVDVSLNGAAGHLNRHLQPNERVISATAAPTDAAATSETFHKRRIVVNHPFQTVREVVEHEPITNYHQIQVNEPASPALYHQAAYYQQPIQTHGNLVQFKSTSTHGNLYAPYG